MFVLPESSQRPLYAGAATRDFTLQRFTPNFQPAPDLLRRCNYVIRDKPDHLLSSNQRRFIGALQLYPQLN